LPGAGGRGESDPRREAQGEHCILKVDFHGAAPVFSVVVRCVFDGAIVREATIAE